MNINNPVVHRIHQDFLPQYKFYGRTPLYHEL